MPWTPKYTVPEVCKLLTSPGSELEVETVCINGRVVRTYKNLPASCQAVWLDAVRKYGSREYSVFGGQRFTFVDIHNRILRSAAILREVYGIEKGDHVGLVSKNLPDLLAIFWACHLLGAVPALVNFRLFQHGMVYCLLKCDCKLVVLDGERADILEPVIEDYSMRALSTRVVVLQGENAERQRNGMQLWTDIYGGYTDDPSTILSSVPTIHPDDDCLIIFTSGTSGGKPKPALCTQRALLTNIFNTIYSASAAALRRGAGSDLDPGQPISVLCPFPLVIILSIHSMVGKNLSRDANIAMTVVSPKLLATFLGSRVVYLDEYNPEQVLRLVMKEGIQSITGSPKLLRELVHMASSKLVGNNLRALACSGGPVRENFARDAQTAFPCAEIRYAYGMTEATGLWSLISEGDFAARPLSCGLLPPVNEVLIVSDDGKVVPRGHSGEIWMRGPSIMKAYYNDPEATAKVMTKDGWFQSGDVGVLCAEGFLYIVDRKKDMIIRDTLNISSIMLENALLEQPGVLEAAAIAVPDEREGEVPVAVVVLKDGYADNTTADSLLAAVNMKLPAHAALTMIILRDERLPRSGFDKVLKASLKPQAVAAWKRRLSLGCKP